MPLDWVIGTNWIHLMKELGFKFFKKIVLKRKATLISSSFFGCNFWLQLGATKLHIKEDKVTGFSSYCIVKLNVLFCAIVNWSRPSILVLLFWWKSGFKPDVIQSTLVSLFGLVLAGQLASAFTCLMNRFERNSPLDSTTMAAEIGAKSSNFPVSFQCHRRNWMEQIQWFQSLNFQVSKMSEVGFGLAMASNAIGWARFENQKTPKWGRVVALKRPLEIELSVLGPHWPNGDAATDGTWTLNYGTGCNTIGGACRQNNSPVQKNKQNIKIKWNKIFF